MDSKKRGGNYHNQYILIIFIIKYFIIFIIHYREPTSAPTSFPTVSPTIPSRSPTGAPTCLYYNSSFFNAYYHKVVIRDHQMLKQTPYINSTGKEHKYTFQTITCSNNTNKANECYIECLDKESCMESIFKPINQLSILSILCGDEKSCKQLNLITN
eukprot:88735_1